MTPLLTRRHAFWALSLFLLAASLRVGWVAYRFGHQLPPEQLSYPDELVYTDLAQSIAAGQGMIDEFGYRATYMPAYPGFLALFAWANVSLFWPRLVQALLAAIAAPLAYCLTLAALSKRSSNHCPNQDCPKTEKPDWRLGASVLAGLLVAGDPFSIFFTGLLLTESLFTVILLATWLSLWPLLAGKSTTVLRSIASGILLGGCLYLRPSSAILVGLIPLWVILSALLRRQWTKDTLIQTTLVVGLATLCLIPWAIRNKRILGHHVWLTTRGGISLYDGLHPGATGASDLASTKIDPAVEGLDELAWQSHFRKQALRYLYQEPNSVLQLAAQKFARTWSLTPNVAKFRSGRYAWISGIWMGLVLLSAGLGAWSLRSHGQLLGTLLLPVIGITLLHMIFVGSVRYRIPVMPMMECLSGVGLAWLVGRYRNLRNNR